MNGWDIRLQEAQNAWQGASGLLHHRWKRTLEEVLQTYSFASIEESEGLFADAVCMWLDVQEGELVFGEETSLVERDLYCGILLCVAYKAPREHVLSSLLHFGLLDGLLMQNLSILVSQLCPQVVQEHLVDTMTKMIVVEDDICSRYSPDMESFEVCVYPVLQGVYELVQAENPSTFFGFGLPVESVSWYEAILFCNALSEQKGFEPVYKLHEHGVVWRKERNGFRLLSELEWQICAQAGGQVQAGDNVFIHCNSGSEKTGTRNVMLGQANPWGLLECFGNVFEWCWDRFQPELPLVMYGPTQGTTRVRRGGGWNSDPKVCTIEYRSERRPEYRSDNTGFRIARTL